MQGGEPVSTMKVSESEGKLEGLATAVTPNNKNSSCGGGISSSSSSSRGGSAKGWQYSDHMENVCGYLMKYTNLVTGWQYRFFVLNNEAGLLEYFVNEQSRNQKPRGTLQLAGAVISPSDEDSHTFTVNAASGEQYKLRATDAKERQHWVSRLQICTQHHTEAIGKNNPPLKSRSFSLASSGNSPISQRRPSQNTISFFNVGHSKLQSMSKRTNLPPDHLVEVREMMSHAEGQQRDLIRGIECLPTSGHLSSLDQDLLMLKATSMATMNCLNDCFHILQLQHASHQKGSLPSGTTIEWLEPKISLSNNYKNGADQPFATEQSKPVAVPEEQSVAESGLLAREPEEINADDEIEDTCDNKEDDLGAVEEQRSVILHLLSQLKLGMDLTRVVLPTFILEKRSLLEMYADFMSHPDLFIAITNGATAEERMIRFVEYYLTSFHEGRKGAIAKKPYNPIIGETFHCSWKMPKSEVASSVFNSSTKGVTNHAPSSEESLNQVGSDCYTVRFVAEQVSHHPPVSGFYAECTERKMCVNAHVWTKSKFLGMSIGVTMVGEGILSLLEHGEEYTFSLPCAYARSILTVPWVELGGKVSVNCAKTGYSASITFHTKPFYGGKLHRVTAEVKHNITNTVVCRVQGEWNSLLEFTYSNGETKYVDLTKLTVTKKRVRPLEKQDPFESRRLWKNVTDSLRESEIDKATEHKRTLEERQRTEERHRTETGTPWKTKYFIKEMTHNNFWLKKIEISVSEAEKRTGRNAMNMQETYTAYLIETRSVEHTDGQSVLTDSLWRRYSEFELLRNYLLVYYPHIVVPPLPEKRAEFVWHKLSADNMDPDFVERRRIGLENFLLRIASHPILCRDKIFYLFLTQEGNWKETVNETGFQLKADSRLKALNATFRVKNPDKRFTDLKHYSDELQSVISHLLRVRARVADRLYGVYKVHGNYGRVFSEWSAIEKEMGDGLQSAGHHMDVYASSIDDILEDEEHYADQLKEYLFYAEALRAVCRKHELMQYDLEIAAQDLASKKQQCEELATGTVRTFSLKGMTTKLFGQETPEQREARIKVLEEQINEGEQQLKSKNLEGREFVKNAWADIERFKEQKNRDLKEALISYAVMQISMCKKGIQVWTNAKECFSKM
uniref:Oxysterol-binding protein n=3 Tax=Cebidae TaxID=9498 RepID=A0A5F4VYP8_CALJA